MFIEIRMIDNRHQNSFWYGGEVATIKHKSYIFHIDAIGDMRGTLLDKNGDELVYVKDKGNNGTFYGEMRHHIKDDKEIASLSRDGRLVMENNNWWECSMTDGKGTWHDLMWCLDSDLILDAVDEVLDTIDEVIEDFELNDACRKEKC